MRAQILLVSVGLFVASAALAQPPGPPWLPRPGDLAPAPSPPIAPSSPPREKSVDELLAQLEDLRAQKAAIEKQEQELAAALRKKLQQQAERVKKLGIAQPAPEPDRVGRVMIEGNVKTPDNKILTHVDLRPGQILLYPAIEESRAKLEKAGFKGATVEVLPNELDSTFKDIRVRVIETKR